MFSRLSCHLEVAFSLLFQGSLETGSLDKPREMNQATKPRGSPLSP